MIDSLAIGLYQHATNRGESFDPTHTGLDHLALAVATYDDLERWAGWLDTHNVPRSPIRAVAHDTRGRLADAAVGSMFDFVDPDGMQIELFSLRGQGTPPG